MQTPDTGRFLSLQGIGAMSCWVKVCDILQFLPILQRPQLTFWIAV